MQPLRTSSRRLPQVYRIIPSRTIHHSRNTMSLFPRFGFTQEFSPLFRLLDDYDRATRQSLNAWPKEIPTFQPKFDVKELKNSYELHGELPGIDQKDVSIEWTDGNTLAIKGRTEKMVERGTRPNAAGVIEDAPRASGAIQAAPAGTDEHYQKPTVADEGEDGASTATGENTALTPATTQGGEVEKAAPQEEAPKYWVSERSVGEFSRSFTFPTRVDHDAVKASMKNGILSIVVPKAQAPRSRQITIE